MNSKAIFRVTFSISQIKKNQMNKVKTENLKQRRHFLKTHEGNDVFFSFSLSTINVFFAYLQSESCSHM